ncbi:MAG: hypothetical protein HZB71_07515 [Betaproteobacteria bacterium]|nr:hypothetical protein [Betaproteobacteria bacterium]
MNLLFALLLALLVAPAQAETQRRTDPDTGALSWETRTQGVAVSLTQLLPDQVLAFYLNRGFPPAAAERFAGACVFMTVLRNESAPGELTFRLADWGVRHAGGVHPPPDVAVWMGQWTALGVSEPARIAFRWAQFPPEQEYAVGEWNQGMLATGLTPGAGFDLVVRWNVAGKTVEGKLDEVRCAR